MDQTVDVNEFLRSIEQNHIHEQQVDKLITKLTKRSNDESTANVFYLIRTRLFQNMTVRRETQPLQRSS